LYLVNTDTCPYPLELDVSNRWKEWARSCLSNI